MVSERARRILGQLRQLLDINTVRLGINPATVLDDRWWPKYRAIVREATDLDMKVILACWESKSRRDGKIDDQRKFDLMWDRVVKDFGDDRRVFFEIFNEPYGYSYREWGDLADGWIQRREKMIKGRDRARILVSGTGYSARLTRIGGDKRFDGCRLSFHFYAWFGGKHGSRSQWKRDIENRIGKPNASRTIVTEWGAPMKSVPQDYYTEQAADGARDRDYLVAMTDVIRNWNMGSVYWPGLREGDKFSLTEWKKRPAILRVTNLSGKKQLLRSFGRDMKEEGYEKADGVGGGSSKRVEAILSEEVRQSGYDERVVIAR